MFIYKGQFQKQTSNKHSGGPSGPWGSILCNVKLKMFQITGRHSEMGQNKGSWQACRSAGCFPSSFRTLLCSTLRTHSRPHRPVGRIFTVTGKSLGHVVSLTPRLWFLAPRPSVSLPVVPPVFQMKERSIQTLGYLPVGDGDFPHQKKLLQGLMDSVEVTLHSGPVTVPTGSAHSWYLSSFRPSRWSCSSQSERPSPTPPSAPALERCETPGPAPRTSTAPRPVRTAVVNKLKNRVPPLRRLLSHPFQT